MELYGTACKLIELIASLPNAHETACKLMELHVSFWNYIQADGTACKLIELLTSSWNLMDKIVWSTKFAPEDKFKI